MVAIDRKKLLNKYFKKYIELTIDETYADLIGYPKNVKGNDVSDDVITGITDVMEKDEGVRFEISKQEITDYSKKAVYFLKAYGKKMRETEKKVLSINGLKISQVSKKSKIIHKEFLDYLNSTLEEERNELVKTPKEFSGKRVLPDIKEWMENSLENDDLMISEKEIKEISNRATKFFQTYSDFMIKTEKKMLSVI